jgi:ketosteroid isomerase-like protein
MFSLAGDPATDQNGILMAKLLEDIAEAFCRHRFDEAIPYLAEDITWSLVGADAITGKTAVVAACESTSADLKDVTTTFTHFRTVSGPDCVVIDSVGEYSEADGGTSVVASCDIFDFTDGQVTAIRSYTIELD